MHVGYEICHLLYAGFEARRNTKTGSYFARFFVYVCSSQAHNTDVNRMMNKVLNTPLIPVIGFITILQGRP